MWFPQKKEFQVYGDVEVEDGIDVGIGGLSGYEFEMV
jgi:hypothetical protein